MDSITVSVTLVHGGADNRELCRAPATKTAFSQFQGGVSRGWGEVSEFVVAVVMGWGEQPSAGAISYDSGDIAHPNFPSSYTRVHGRKISKHPGKTIFLASKLPSLFFPLHIVDKGEVGFYGHIQREGLVQVTNPLF